MSKGINQTRGLQFAVLGAVCALVIGVYAWSARPGHLELTGAGAEDTYYNLLVQGFRAGQLSVKREVPPGLVQLADPYDPAANGPYRDNYPLGEMSYYKGKLHLYFGITPALVLFWPYVALTGRHLFHQDAVVILFSVGFLASVGLLWAVWRRYFAEIRFGAMVAATLAIGLAGLAPAILARSDVWEVAISCGYALTMVTLTLIWRALHAPKRRVWWLVGASLAYGLAVGARPSLLFGAVILLVPAANAWRAKQRVWPLLMAAAGPIALIGFVLLLYNALRFDHPLEFGQRYQLVPVRQDTMEQFSLRYLWFNFRVGFLEPAGWSGRFPFVHGITVPPLVRGGGAEQPFGVLTNIPLVWLVLAVPLAWRSRLAGPRSILRWFLAAVALLFGTCALIILLHNSMCLRYEVEFLSALVLLAAIGIFVLERALAGQPVWRHTARWGWGVLLGVSVAFNILATFGSHAVAAYNLGTLALQKGQLDKAIVHFREALEIQPDLEAVHCNLGAALLRQGKVAEGIGHFEQSVRLDPSDGELHYNLGNALIQLGKVTEAIGYYEQAVQFKPDFFEAQKNLGEVLLRISRVPEAVGHLEEAVRLKPDCATAHHALGNALNQQGKMSEARTHLERAVQLKPDYAEAHNHLAVVLVRLAEISKAIPHLEQAVRLEPKYADARNNLSKVLFQFGEQLAAQGQWYKAIVQYKQALEFEPGSAQVHESLALALCQRGRYGEAVQHYQKVLAKNPRSVTARNNLAWVLATCPDGKVRNGAWAVGLARKANSLAERKDPGMLDTLAAAYAEAGRFAEAVQTAQAALELAKGPEEDEKAKRIEGRLGFYQAKQPYREGTVRLAAPTATGKQKARTASGSKIEG